MATSQDPNKASFSQEDRERVRALDEEALKWSNILKIRGDIKKTAKEESIYNKLAADLSAEQKNNAQEYSDVTTKIEQGEKRLAKEREKGARANRTLIKTLEADLKGRQLKQEKLLKTEGGYIEAQSAAASKRLSALEAEKSLIKDINKQRGLGAKFLDLFRSKEEKQRLIEVARLKAGAGPNVGAAATGGNAAGAGGGKGGGKGGVVTTVAGALGLGGVLTALAAIKAGFDSISAPIKAVGNALKTGFNSSLIEATKLIGGGYGIGGGAVSGEGATSILGGLSGIAKSIPFIGGLLGGLIDGFKAVLDAVLGIDQANTRLGRNLGISKDAARALNAQFREIASSSDSIVVNQARLAESQVELGQQLGVNNILTGDILSTNIKLKELAGLELESRKAIAESAIITGRTADSTLGSVTKQIDSFRKLTGVSFNFQKVMSEASKLGGVLGLQFAKLPGAVTNAMMKVKALGFDLKGLNDQASGLLDFESSIAKEMEASVILGRDLNLTKAREAALNNDLVTLAKEINAQVGSTEKFLKMQRIDQEALAAAVGMSRDSLADSLKMQMVYTNLGAKSMKEAAEKLAILKAQGKTQAEINALVDEDTQKNIMQVSTAEKLTEVMNKIKSSFVEFIEKSHLLDFLTNPQRINDFLKSVIGGIAGTINMVGEIVAGIMDAISHLPGTDKEYYQGLASRIREGAGGAAGAIMTVGENLGGSAAGSIGETMQAGAVRSGTTTATSGGTSSAGNPQIINVNGVLNVDGQKQASFTMEQIMLNQGTFIK